MISRILVLACALVAVSAVPYTYYPTGFIPYPVLRRAPTQAENNVPVAPPASNSFVDGINTPQEPNMISVSTGQTIDTSSSQQLPSGAPYSQFPMFPSAPNAPFAYGYPLQSSAQTMQAPQTTVYPSFYPAYPQVQYPFTPQQMSVLPQQLRQLPFYYNPYSRMYPAYSSYPVMTGNRPPIAFSYGPFEKRS